MKRVIKGISLGISTILFTAVSAVGQNIVVDAAPSHAVNSFSPLRALGAGVDRLKGPKRLRIGNAETVLGEPLLREMLSAGWQPVTYRQNTELQVEAWHWNPRGTWSDAEKQAGYFTGSAEPAELIRHSFAYPLPHRGFSQGDGKGWSRLTDGDPKSYWKSNPYLTRDFTGEDDSLHPQWVMIDLGRKVEINASGITRGLPTMVPIAMLFSTPEDAAAEIAYLYKRRYPISWIEMGEEADGQHMLPEDYGALYLQFATAIHRLVPEVKLGGPAFEGVNTDVEVWPDSQGRASWLSRFLDYLKAHGRLNDFTFFSYEHYPFSFDMCHIP